MKARGAAIQGGLAALGLVVAYTTWQRGPEVDAGDEPVLNFGRSDIEQVRYEDAEHFTVLTRGEGGAEPAVWVRYGTKPKPAAADGGVASDGGVADAGVLPANHPPMPPPLPVAPDRDLRGNTAANTLLDQVSSLRAMRALGVLPAEKLKEVGLTGSARHFTVTARGVPYVFSVAPGASGLNGAYLRSEADGKVYVLSVPVMSELENSTSRLVDRRLHDFKAEDWDLLRVTAKGQTRELEQRDASGNSGGKLYARGSDKADEFASNWQNKVARLAPVEMLGRGELPPGGAPPVDVRLDYSYRGKPVGFLEVGKSKLEWYVRTELTASWVKVTFGADDVVRESVKVLNP